LRILPQPGALFSAAISVEHIIARALGGQTEADNLALSCQGCNGHKYIKWQATDPLTEVIVSLFHPRQQQWRDHFGWNEDATLIVGLTPTGRATIEALKMNRIELINLREVLYAAQKHPLTEFDDE
jgi:HNH endonuclease